MKMYDCVLGIPKEVADNAFALFERIGIGVKRTSRQFLFQIDGLGPFNKVVLMKSVDLIARLLDGTLDAIIVGEDWLAELKMANKITKIAKLDFGKKANRPVRVAVIGKTDKIIDTPDTRVIAEYPGLARRFFKKARIDCSTGSSEVQVLLGAYDYAVCVVESGESVAANGLRVVREIMVSSMCLVAKKSTPELAIFGEVLQGGLKSENFQLLKMNIEKEHLEQAIRALPALKSPTINQLAGGSFAVETVVAKTFVLETLIALKQIGATDILVQDINVLI